MALSVTKAEKALDVGPVAITRDRAPTGILVVLRRELSATTLGRILALLKEFPLLRVLASGESESRCLCYVIIDAKGKAGRVREVVRSIRAMNGVETVEVCRPLGNLLIEVPFDIVVYSGFRVMVFTQPAFGAFIRALQETLGPSGTAILYHMGFSLGSSAFKSHLPPPSVRNRYEIAMTITKEFLRASGIGRVELTGLNRRACSARVRVWGNFECELFKGSASPTSHFVRGIIAGWLSAYFNREVYAEETRCIAVGDSYCEFRIRRA